MTEKHDNAKGAPVERRVMLDDQYQPTDLETYGNAAAENLNKLAMALEKRGKTYGATQVRKLAAHAKQWAECV